MADDQKRKQKGKRKRVTGTPKTTPRKQKVAAAKKAALSKPPAAARKRSVATSKQAPPRAPMVPAGRGAITEPVPFDGIGGTLVSTVQEQPPHPRPALHVVDPSDTTKAAHHQVAVNTATAQSTHIAAIAASSLIGVAATGEIGNLQSVSVDGIPAELGAETSPIRVVPVLRPDWTLGADEALRNAVEAFAFYRKAHALFAPLEAGLQRDRDNRLDDVPQALAELCEDEATADATVRVLREQIGSATPSATSVQQAGYVFRTLTHGAKSFAATASRWITEGLVKGEAAHVAPGLIDQLRHALHRVAEVIASLFQ